MMRSEQARFEDGQAVIDGKVAAEPIIHTLETNPAQAGDVKNS